MTDSPSTFHVTTSPGPGDARSMPQRIEDELARRVFRVAAPIDALAVAFYLVCFALHGNALQVAVCVAELAPLAWAFHLARRGRHDRALLFVLWPAWLANAILAAAEGGIGGTSAWWLAVPPAVLIQGGALRSGAAMIVLSVVELLACHVLREAGLLPVLIARPAFGDLQVGLAVSGSIAGLTAAVWMGVRWRRELLLELDALREDAEEATRVKSRFIANMSHEIRTPLHGIVGAAELLRLSPLDAGQERAAQIIDHSAQALLDVVNDVLDFSKLEAQRVELERLDVDPAALAYDIAETFGGQAHERGVELWAHAAADVPAQIQSDPVRLRQVLHNLVSNALKFTEVGEIRIDVSVRPAGRTGGASLRFAVRDTGIGLDVAQQARLFRAFTQADLSTTRRFGGTGLGLAICRELTGLLGGRLELDSAPGVGSTFALLLPLQTDGTARGARVPARADGPPRQSLLICTASAALRDDLQDWAGRRGDVVHATSTGTPEDWIASALVAGADLVVMDDEALRAAGLSRGTWAARLHDAGLVGVLMIGVSVPVATVPAGLVPLYKPARPARLEGAVREARRSRAKQARAVPVAAPPGVDPLPVAAETAPPRARVLLVEDNVVNQAVATALLAQLNVASDVAPDGGIALEMLGDSPDDYAAVLMDCQMPVLDGFAATRAWREREALAGRRRLPIIAMTANSIAEVGAACTAAGMDDFISKPFSKRELGGVLARWLPPSPT